MGKEEATLTVGGNNGEGTLALLLEVSTGLKDGTVFDATDDNMRGGTGKEATPHDHVVGFRGTGCEQEVFLPPNPQHFFDAGTTGFHQAMGAHAGLVLGKRIGKMMGHGLGDNGNHFGERPCRGIIVEINHPLLLFKKTKLYSNFVFFFVC